MKIAVLGASGQLGRALAHALPGGAIALDRCSADLEQAGHAAGAIVRLRPRVVINAAAWTDVDGAESDEHRATRINGHAVAELVEATASIGARLLQVSTDYVFDGRGTTPWLESDPPSPINAYGRSKLVGERACSAARHACVVRTSWLHSGHGRNFIASILGLARRQPSLRVVDDQVGAPTSASWLAQSLAELAAHALTDDGLPSILHAVPTGYASWHAVACHALRHADSLGIQLACRPEAVTAIRSHDYPSMAMRPCNSRLAGDAIGPLLALPRPCWQVGVEHTVRLLVGAGS